VGVNLCCPRLFFELRPNGIPKSLHIRLAQCWLRRPHLSLECGPLDGSLVSLSWVHRLCRVMAAPILYPLEERAQWLG
jgi:hypothetical protein